MASPQSWIKAARLRTLPLALASIAMGGFVAAKQTSFNLNTVLMAALTTLFLQILSNFANDYGDATSGIDNHKRVGPKRTVQSGEVTPGEMKLAMLVFSVLSLLSGLWLIFLTANLGATKALVFVLLGLAAIAAAIKYTVGKNPYGYAGLGDLFVFVFFGITAVGGTYFLATTHFEPIVLLPATAMGFFSTGVLNLNNMRDIENDQENGKMTLAVKLGARNALRYHQLLIYGALGLLVLFVLLSHADWTAYLFLLLLPVFVVDLRQIKAIKHPRDLDPFLKKLALKTLLLTIVFGISLLL